MGISRNNGDGTFTTRAVPVTVAYGNAGKWGDLDNDGDFDLAFSGSDAGITKPFTQIYRNDGAGNLTAAVTNIPVGSDGSIDFRRL